MRVAGRWAVEFILQSIADTGPLSGQWAMWSRTRFDRARLRRLDWADGARSMQSRRYRRCIGVLLGLLTLPGFNMSMYWVAPLQSWEVWPS